VDTRGGQDTLEKKTFLTSAGDQTSSFQPVACYYTEWAITLLFSFYIRFYLCIRMQLHYFYSIIRAELTQKNTKLTPYYSLYIV
jgi:hypothetical protein